MTGASWLQYVFLAHFSKPKAERQLYRLVKKHGVAKLFELGVADLARTTRLIRVAERYADGATVKYAALDMFDARDADDQPLPLIDAHRTLQATAATARLLPGDPTALLSNVANADAGTDLLLVAPWLTDDDLAPVWPWLPRMLHSQSVVLRESIADDGMSRFATISLDEIDQRAATHRRAA